MTSHKIQNEVLELYYELGISEPKDIDLEGIAFYKNAIVKRKPLCGCEARIIGVDSKAIITVNETSSIERQNFSIGHELGHWFKDRGKIGNLCSKSDLGENCQHKVKPSEKIANDFASELIIPHFMLKPVITGTDFSLDAVRYVKSLFAGSFMATIRRIIAMNHHMAFFASYNKEGIRNYFNHTPQLPGEFFPPQRVPIGSAIHTLIKTGNDLGPTVVDGDIWCREDLASGAVVHEHAFHYHKDEFLTLVWWKDEEPIWSFSETKNGY